MGQFDAQKAGLPELSSTKLNLPPAFDVHLISGLRLNVVIGDTREHPLYYIEVKCGMSFGMAFHDGPTPDAPPLGFWERDSRFGFKHKLTIGGGKEIKFKPSGMLSEGLQFVLPAGPEGLPAKFAWHSAKRAEVSDVGESKWNGWKLVCEDRHEAGTIVAVFASTKLKDSFGRKMGRFAFRDDAAAGGYGSEFAVAALLSLTHMIVTRLTSGATA